MEVIFSNDDLLLRTPDHNHPLYISINIDNFKLSHVLIDPRLSVNIMSLRTPTYHRVDTNKLSSNKMIWRGFNENSERVWV